MTDYLLSVLLGTVEGLTEFLPVSSTAHLLSSEVLLNVPLDSGYWKMYSIVIQLGAILVLPIYFRQHIAKLISTFPQGEKKDYNYLTHPLSLVMIAFVVTAIPSFLLTKVIGKNLESLYVIGTALLIGGIVMWIIDAMKAPWEKAGPGAAGSPIHTWKMDDIHGGQAVWIGACQILSAVFPRHLALHVHHRRRTTDGNVPPRRARILLLPLHPHHDGGDALHALQIASRGKDENPIGVAQVTPHQWVILAIGFVVSFIVAYGAVAWFMGWVRKRGFAPFRDVSHRARDCGAGMGCGNDRALISTTSETASLGQDRNGGGSRNIQPRPPGTQLATPCPFPRCRNGGFLS